MRTTRKELRERIKGLRNHTGLDLSIEWAYGQPRVYQGTVVTTDRGRSVGRRELSPRLPTGQMKWWLYAYSAGYNANETRRF